jgi:hypothetical protein
MLSESVRSGEARNEGMTPLWARLGRLLFIGVTEEKLTA